MADYADNTGKQYVMNNFYTDGVKETNAKMGYNNMSDKANTGKTAQPMKAAKSDTQLPSSSKFGY